MNVSVDASGDESSNRNESPMRVMKRVLKLLAVAVVAVVMVYAGAQAEERVRAQARCATLAWAHSMVTYDFHEYCWTIYMGSEAIGPIDKIEKLVHDMGPGPQQIPQG